MDEELAVIAEQYNLRDLSPVSLRKVAGRQLARLREDVLKLVHLRKEAVQELHGLARVSSVDTDLDAVEDATQALARAVEAAGDATDALELRISSSTPRSASSNTNRMCPLCRRRQRREFRLLLP